MTKNAIIRRAFINSGLTFSYVLLIVMAFNNAQFIFETDPPEMLIASFMLLLFMFSALVTSSLVLGKPILMYIDGQKKEAVSMFVATAAWLVVFLAVIVVIMLALQ